jgi:NADH:ubiquinone oxidoreductase subunit F (NADH-binding)
MSQRGVRLGHGGLVALPAGTDWQALLEHWLTLMERESCGRCAPCALGSAEALRLARRPAAAARRELLELLETIACASLCAFGQQIPGPVRRILERRSTGGGP